MGGVTNTIFLAFLEFFNQLLPDDGEALPVNTYEAKKFLRDMGLGYEKIWHVVTIVCYFGRTIRT
jgi:hypothetical protein